MTMKQRSVMIATLGFAPQIITRTVDFLRWPKFWYADPALERVILVRTGRYNAGHSPWPTLNHFRHYFEETYPQIILEELPIKDSAGNEVQDVETVANSELTFNTIFGRVKTLKAEGYRCHGVIAGGRKSMTIYLMVTAQLLFSEGDKLWHLISDKETQEPHVLGVESEDSSTLVEVPTYYLANALPMLHQLVINSHNPASALRHYQRHATPAQLWQLDAFYKAECDNIDRRILRLAYLGMSNREIGEQDGVNLSESAVINRIRNMAERFYGRKMSGRIRSKFIDDLSPYLKSEDAFNS